MVKLFSSFTKCCGLIFDNTKNSYVQGKARPNACLFKLKMFLARFRPLMLMIRMH